MDLRYFKRENGRFVELTGLTSTPVTIACIHLPPRTRQIARLIRDGKTVAQAAKEMGITTNAARVRLCRAYREFGIPRRERNQQIMLCALLLLPLDSPFRTAIEARLTR